MAQLRVSDISPELFEKLKKRAQRKGHSLEAEVTAILEAAVQRDPVSKPDMAKFRRLVEEIHEGWKGQKFSDSVELIREDRDQ